MSTKYAKIPTLGSCERAPDDPIGGTPVEIKCDWSCQFYNPKYKSRATWQQAMCAKYNIPAYQPPATDIDDPPVEPQKRKCVPDEKKVVAPKKRKKEKEYVPLRILNHHESGMHMITTYYGRVTPVSQIGNLRQTLQTHPMCTRT